MAACHYVQINTAQSPVVVAVEFNFTIYIYIYKGKVHPRRGYEGP